MHSSMASLRKRRSASSNRHGERPTGKAGDLVKSLVEAHAMHPLVCADQVEDVRIEAAG
jgi:hypothetical protein